MDGSVFSRIKFVKSTAHLYWLSRATLIKCSVKPAKIRALFKGIATGIFPSGMRAKDLALIQSAEGEPALTFAIRCGHYPTGTTARELATVHFVDGYTALHQAAEHNCFPPKTTVNDLANCKADDGWTALHIAAGAGCLPNETTVQDLLNAKDNNGHSAFEESGPTHLLYPLRVDQMPMVLENTLSTSSSEMEMIGKALQEKYPVAGAVWVQKEMQKHIDKKHHISRI